MLEFVRKKLIQLQWAVAFAPPLLTRLVVGWGFYWTGNGKINHIDNIVEMFQGLGIPYPELQAPFVARLEYYGGMLLAVGLLTRLTAFLLSSTMVVALATADKETFLGTLSADSEKFPVEVTAFTYFAFLIWLVVYGAGTLSLDRLLTFGYDRLRKKSAEDGE